MSRLRGNGEEELQRGRASILLIDLRRVALVGSDVSACTLSTTSSPALQKRQAQPLGAPNKCYHSS